jgi:hypothetical protein
MKKLIFLFILIFSFNLKAEIKDTTKQSIKLDSKTEIINNLFKCFANTKFDSLIIFCEEDIDFYVEKSDGKIYHMRETDCAFLCDLNVIFKNTEYNKFHILSGKDINGQEVLLVTLFASESDQKAYLNIYFYLSTKQSITKVIILH